MTSKITRRGILIGVSASAGTLTISAKDAVAGSPKTHDVKIRAFRFEPQHLVVRDGDTLRWTNEDLAPHTATATHASWDTGEIGKGESMSIPVTKEMEITYFCAFHPHMKGSVELM